MKAVISTTYDNNYLFFLPIVTWCWNKLGVDVICFMPYLDGIEQNEKIDCINDTFIKIRVKPQYVGFDAPEHKQATYAQCSRLYASALDLPEDEILIISDVDMALFKIPPYEGGVTIFGSDLTPKNQYPMCYASAKYLEWWKIMGIGNKTHQQCLDELLGGIDAEHFRGNYWGKDQETLFNRIDNYATPALVPRARPGTQFASKRIDRDDAYWEERLTPDIIDAHLWRPGYTDENFPKILKLLKYFYPYDNFDWLIEYKDAYKKLL